MIDQLLRLFGDRKGAAAIEYGLIAALIALVAIFALRLLGIRLGDTFNLISNALTISA